MFSEESATLRDTAMIGQSIGHYKILDKLGEGEMGEVYLAEDTTLAALNHPKIVMIFSVQAAAEVHLLTMELVDSKSLDQSIPSEGFAVEKFLRLTVPLAEAVAAAHAKGITNRDLKPANVLVTNEDHRVKALDFGLAKLQHTSTWIRWMQGALQPGIRVAQEINNAG